MAPRYRLELRGVRTVRLTRAQLERLPQHTYELPISCVEGWVTTQTWTGVRLRDLARVAGVARPGSAHLESVETRGQFRQATLDAAQVTDERTLLALAVNGAELSIDHGYPARAIVPAAPGVHNTKWVARITFA
jgi:DMSO/TMAO reductase YedYZ molybdopterin-dependent catalytic subunit